MSLELIVSVPPYLCANAYELFNHGQAFPLGKFIAIGAQLLESDFQAYST